MNIERISDIIGRLEQSSINDFEVEVNGILLRGHFTHTISNSQNKPDQVSDHSISTSTAIPASATPPSVIKAPSMGVFSTTHPLTNNPCTSKPGEDVVADQIVGFIALGTIIQPVLAPFGGKLKRRLVDEGQVIGYGQPLFLMN